MIYVGIIPAGLFRNLRLPEAGRLAEYFLKLQDESEEGGKESGEETAPEEAEANENAAGPQTGEEEKEEVVPVEEEDPGRILIELSENLPEIEESDLYDLTEVLRNAGALRAVDGQGKDCSDQIVCELTAYPSDPGLFKAAFSVETEDGLKEEGPLM